MNGSMGVWPCAGTEAARSRRRRSGRRGDHGAWTACVRLAPQARSAGAHHIVERGSLTCLFSFMAIDVPMDDQGDPNGPQSAIIGPAPEEPP